MEKIVTLIIFIFMVSCNPPNSDLQRELNDAKTALKKAEAKILELQKDAQEVFVHEVYFNIKDDLSKEEVEEFILALNRIRQISVVENLRIGKFENMNDQRALSDYEIIMSIDFVHKEDYKEYQTHPIHLDLKTIARKFLDEPPRTFDYLSFIK